MSSSASIDADVGHGSWIGSESEAPMSNAAGSNEKVASGAVLLSIPVVMITGGMCAVGVSKTRGHSGP
jgi:hypothetical protein